MNSEPTLPQSGTASAQALAALLRRLEDKPGFPALSESVAAINAINNSEDQNIDGLSATILKDFGLTSSILRVANSATYCAAGGISTVSRAISVLGFSTLRDIALTVVLFEQMKNRAGAREVKEAFMRAQLAGTIAREAGKLCMPRKAEEVYTCALLHSLGKILTLLYFPEETQRIRDLIDRQGDDENHAATRVLGLDYASLGQGIAKQWLFPAALVHSLQLLPDGVIEPPQTPEDMLWMLSGFGNEVCTSLAAGAEPEEGRGMSDLRRRFAKVMAISSPQLHSLVQKSFDDAKVFASTLGVSLTQSNFVRQVAAWVKAGPDDEARNGKSAAGGGGTDAAGKNAATAAAAATSQQAEATQQMLASGINAISNTIVGDFALNDIFRIALETMLGAMDFQRALVCLKDERSGYMLARLGCGKDADSVVRKFRFLLDDAPNVFQLAIGNGLDIVINDISAPKIADKIPPWYRGIVSAKAFILMPLMIKERAVGLIYCDRQEANSIRIPEREMSLLKTLRNHVLLAIRQAD